MGNYHATVNAQISSIDGISSSRKDVIRCNRLLRDVKELPELYIGVCAYVYDGIDNFRVCITRQRVEQLVGATDREGPRVLPGPYRMSKAHRRD